MTSPTLFVTDIHVWKARFDISAEFLTPERRVKMERYRNPEDQLRSLAAGLLLRRAFGERVEMIRRNPHGKPFLDEGPFFSLSHSGRRVLLAVDSRGPIGCDIEHRKNVDAQTIAKHLFHPAEYSLLQNANDSEKTRLFYRLWTLKESYQKMVGLGFSLAPNRFRIEMEPEIRLTETPEAEKNPFFRVWEEDGDDTLAICAQADPARMQQIFIDEL